MSIQPMWVVIGMVLFALVLKGTLSSKDDYEANNNEGKYNLNKDNDAC